MNQINVTDMDQAIAWYTEMLGFSVSEDNYFPPKAVDLVQNGNIRLILYLTDKPTKIDYPNVAQSIIIFKTDNLVFTCKELQDKGVEFIYPKPIKFPSGLFNAFRDPFGNVHEMVQLDKD